MTLESLEYFTRLNFLLVSPNYLLPVLLGIIL